MTRSDAWTNQYRDWRDQHALPLWAGAGIDAATSTSWEALDHHGAPLRDLNRRQRVQFRQAIVFARSDDTDIRALAWQLFSRTMDHGFAPQTGYFSTWVTPDLDHLDQNHDLYDLAFGILAAAALGAAGFDVAQCVDQLLAAVTVLNAPLGWYETQDRRLPRRQNPHMHLFEATTALYAVTHDPAHLAIAQECLEVFTTHALQADGSMVEFFDADWTALTGPEQAQEPGHMAEWIYLADRFRAVTGHGTGLPLTQMWDNVLEHRLPSGFLPDAVGRDTRRLWPQTEFIKAATVLHKHGHALPLDATPEALAALLWDGYMNTPVKGGWYDGFCDKTGNLTSTNMPASTFYHIDLAIEALCDLPPADRSDPTTG